MLTRSAPEPLLDDAPPARRSRRRLFAWTGAGLLALLIATIAWLFITAPLGRALEPLDDASLILLAADGSPIARRGAYKEAPVDPRVLPPHVTDAFLSIEDRRFFEHWGVDPAGIARAALTNARAGAVVQGGSTLTQQLAKTSFLTSDRSYKRKAQEVIIALWLEAGLTKNEILQRYLSSVYFGDGAYGLRAAARSYFATTPERLTVGQAAMLAGLVKAPTRLAPSNNIKGARERARVVLAAMVDNGKLTPRAAERIRLPRYTPGREELPTGSWFTDWVLPQARANLGEADYGEARVRTTLDPRLQRDAEAAVRRALAGPGTWLGARQAALIAMRPDGEVVALVGGRDYKTSQFNRATLARRQPGSSFKLFVYLAALREGWRPSSTIDDTPLTIGDWSPGNDEGKYRGTISLATAFAASSNMAAIRLAQAVGTGRVIAEARRLGVRSPLTSYPSLALGTSPMTLMELTAAYAAVASGRYPVEPYGLAGRRPEGVARGIRRLARDLRPWPAREPMLQLLRSAVRNGTGLAARLPVPAYGKTGTTQDYRDALFVGFAGDLIVGVWVGNDDNSPMNGVVGGGLPAEIWRQFMLSALRRDGAIRPPPVSVPQVLSDVGAVIDEVADTVDTVATAVPDLVDAPGEPEVVAEPPPRAEPAEAAVEP